MPTSVVLPALGESVTEGTISRWLKRVGDHVDTDEPLVEVSTDKVDTEIPSPVAGVLLEIRYEEDAVAEVGAVLAVIGDEAPAEPRPQAEPQAPARIESVWSVEPVAPRPPASAPLAGIDVVLPPLGESVTEGIVSRWLKKVGEHVDADEPLLEVSTDKVDTEIPSPGSGTLAQILVDEDEVAAVGSVVGVIEPSAVAAPPAAGGAGPAEAPARAWAAQEAGDDAAAAPARRAAPEPEPAPGVPEPASAAYEPAPVVPGPVPAVPEPAPAVYEPAPAVTEPATVAEPASGAGDRSAYVTPVVRKIAADGGIDLADVRGSGVGGRIRKQDVLEAIEARKAAEAPAPTEAGAPLPSAPGADTLRGTTQKMSRLRATIATRMVESLQVSAQLTATVEVDLTRVSQLRAQVKDEFRAREGVGLSYLPFIAKAITEALKAYPMLNASIDTQAGTITYAGAEHLGIAVDTERGLLVPVIHDAGDLSVTGLAKKIADLAGRTRDAKVTPDELAGGTFTITNYGWAGTLMDTPIINQPQSGILGVGAIVRRPMVVSDPGLGEIVAIRDMSYLSLSYDHRLVDGADAGRFLGFVKQRLETGDFAGEFVR